MALSREKKTELIESYGEKMARAQVMIWTEQKGLTVDESTDLRGRVRDAGGNVVVVKNTLLREAMKSADLTIEDVFIEGPNMVTFVYDDIAPVAKAVVDFVGEHQNQMQLKGGLIEGKVAGVDQVRSLTDLPSREMLLSRMVGGFQAPISGLVNGLAGIMRGFVTVLDARRQQLEEGEAQASA